MAKKLFNPDAVERIERAHPKAASAAKTLIDEADNHGAGSAEVVLRYDKPEDRHLGDYEILVILRVQLRSESEAQ